MNIYRVIILSALIGRFVLELISEWLNRKSLNAELPEEVKDLYDAEKYRRSQEYAGARARFQIVESTFHLAVLLIFWFAGGLDHLDLWVRSWNLNPVWTGLLYIGLLSIAMSILGLPFSIYSTFVVEERFGFNKTTPRTFVADHLKGLLLMIVLGGPLLAMILWFFQVAGSNAWLYCWIVATVFVMGIQFIAPVWIMPWFHKFTSLQEGELKSAIVDYAKSVRFTFQDIFVVDGSRRSTKPNAFFTGFGKSKRIALFDTLVAENTIPEVVAVLAHEIGHYKKKHVLVMMTVSLLHLGLLFFVLSLFMNNKELFSAFYVEHVSVYVSLLLFGLLYEPISFGLSILMNMFSRRHELQADRHAVETTGNPEQMVSALKKLSVKSLTNLTPHPFYVLLNYSHPPLLQRIQSIRVR